MKKWVAVWVVLVVALTLIWVSLAIGQEVHPQIVRWAGCFEKNDFDTLWEISCDESRMGMGKVEFMEWWEKSIAWGCAKMAEVREGAWTHHAEVDLVEMSPVEGDVWLVNYWAIYENLERTERRKVKTPMVVQVMEDGKVCAMWAPPHAREVIDEEIGGGI